MGVFPSGLRLERLRRDHPRADFHSGQPAVDQWIRSQTLQSQDKRLSTTRVLLDAASEIAGFYTLAAGQVDFGALPADVAKGLPRRALPVAVLAWLGVAVARQGRGLGSRLLARALLDSHEAGSTFPFVGVILDAIDERAAEFYARWDFRAIPERPTRLFLSSKVLDTLVRAPGRLHE